MRTLLLRLILPLLLAVPALLHAQLVPPSITNHWDYDAWKHQFVAPQGALAHPAPPATPTDPSNPRGGSATCNCWVTPNGSYTTIHNDTQWNADGFQNGDDGSYGPINLPFNFYLYGQNWNVAYININGNVSFGNYYGIFSSTGFPVSDFTMVAPFWADVDLRGSGGPGVNKVQYKVTSTAFYVNWTNVGYYDEMTDKLNSFQLIITDGTDPVVPNGANVSFCYGDMQWTTGEASEGVNGFGGTPASVGANKGDGVNYIQFGRFDHAGTDYDGPFGANDGVSFLDNKLFTFATNQTTGNVPPVVTGQSVCDSLTICTDQVTQLSVDFLSPEPDQITTPTSFAPTLSSYTVVSATPGLSAHIITQVTPTIADTGYHVVTFQGTDNGSPVMTSTLTIVVHVLASPHLVSDSLLVCDNTTPFNMLTVLGGNPTSGGDWTAPDGSVHDSLFIPGEDMNGGYTYTVGSGTSCAATGVATITNVAHAYAGRDTTLAYCSWDDQDPLFPRIPGTPQSGGTWIDPVGSPFNGTLHPSTAAPGTYLYLRTGTPPCPNDTAFLTIAIPRAVHAGVDSTVTLCRDTPPLSLRSLLGGAPDATGTWTDAAGDTIPDLFVPATGAIGVYTYTVPAVLPCPDQSAVLTLYLDTLPNSGNGNILIICANGPVTPLFPLLTGGPDHGGQWLDPAGSDMSGLLDPTAELSGNYAYVTIGPGTCSHLTDTAIVAVTVNPLAVITFTADPDSGCNPLQVLFTNTTDPIYVGNSCIWDFGDGSATENACGNITHSYADAGWYTVKLQVTTPQNCTTEVVHTGAVLVEPAPKATFVYTPNPGTADNPNLVFTGTDPHAVSFQWTFPDLSIQSGKQVYYTFPNKIGDVYPVCLSVLDRYGCADTLCDSVPIIVPDFWVPTAFTPDNNGVNDVFKPVALNMAPNDYHMWIFDRWGELVFDSPDPDKGWDGKGRSGGILPEGTYVWRISYRPAYTANKLNRFGTVTLMK